MIYLTALYTDWAGKIKGAQETKHKVRVFRMCLAVTWCLCMQFLFSFLFSIRKIRVFWTLFETFLLYLVKVLILFYNVFILGQLFQLMSIVCRSMSGECVCVCVFLCLSMGVCVKCVYVSIFVYEYLIVCISVCVSVWLLLQRKWGILYKTLKRFSKSA